MSNLSSVTLSLDVHRDGMVIVWIGGYPYSANNASALWRVLQDLNREPAERLAQIEQAERVRKENSRKHEAKRAENRSAVAEHELKMVVLREEKRKQRELAGPWTGIKQLAERLASERSEGSEAKPRPKVQLTLADLGLAPRP